MDGKRTWGASYEYRRKILISIPDFVLPRRGGHPAYLGAVMIFAALNMIKNPLMWIGGAVLAVTIAYQAGSWRGYTRGVSAVEARNLQATLDQIKERGQTNETIRNMGDADLCRALGGSMRNGQCE